MEKHIKLAPLLLFFIYSIKLLVNSQVNLADALVIAVIAGLSGLLALDKRDKKMETLELLVKKQQENNEILETKLKTLENGISAIRAGMGFKSLSKGS
jgi:hypothetical protein